MKRTTMIVLAAFAVFFLAGCGTMNSTIAGLEQKSVADVRAANDNAIHGVEASICAMPIGAVIRNTEFVPIARAACLPAGSASSPVTLFDAMPTGQGAPPAK
jgi:hypothetical protein